MSQLFPRLVKAGIVLLDPSTGKVLRVISLQYNPDSVTRTLQIQGISEGGDRSEALRLKGPAIETFKLEAELDAADQLEFPEQNPNTVQYGLQPQIAALEALLNPTSVELINQNTLAQAGTLEIAPGESPLTLFVWSAQRVVPVRVTDFSVTEDAFDPSLNPIRAKLSLGLRTLTVDDLPFTHRGTSIFLNYLQAKERLAGLAPSPALSTLGIGGIP
ncbi:MAG TPA: hypothetical protein VJS18_09620 [Paraburkholderia sp.]|nr:hypothetical protein [Paraburkholderia sp.]